MTKIKSQNCYRYSILPIISASLCLTTYASNAQQYPVNIPHLTAQTLLPSAGNQINLNGKDLPGTWVQEKTTNGRIITHLSDAALRQLIGVDLLNTNNPQLQPVEWFSPEKSSITLKAKLLRGYRYLDISRLAQTKNWQLQARRNTLVISTLPANINNIRQGKQSWGDRLVLDLDRPTPWKILQSRTLKKPVDPENTTTPTTTPTTPQFYNQWVMILDAKIADSFIKRYTQTEELPPEESAETPKPNLDLLIQKVELVNNQTKIYLSIPQGLAPKTLTLANPSRLVIDIRPDALVTKSITWTKGLRWQQKLIDVGKDRFAVVWLEINPRTVGLQLKPILANPASQTGIAPLIKTAQRDLAVAAINGGYFNRNNKLPLGALRRNNQWISGPILNRGAIAWNDRGEFYFNRLTLKETLITNTNNFLPIRFLNSGYVQNGIARYTPTWGATYTPLIDNEILIVVENNTITNSIEGGQANTTPIPIPKNGYLLTLRGKATTHAPKLTIGKQVTISSTTESPNFSRFPHIIGAGPLLLKNKQIVLDAKSEKFSDRFIAGKAVRSGICTTTTGNLIIAAVHDRVGGRGPNLAEHAKLMQIMGCVNALNLDGGSSTSLYLGGQLLNRSPNTAARVHNALGIFLKSR
ncbi:MAG: hypothetical protein F6K62_06370 [Sphaerospermopsis sp. SIO1G2]|nr:hypothetical protein [Sphaerospermopsis sp. SIO1G2]